jgi:cytochrome P450
LEDSTLLGTLIAARYYEADVRLNDQELRDEVMTIFLAGHETCANALTWTFYLLALYPEVQERLAEEVEHVLNRRPPTFEDIHRLPYTEMVFNEVLRLYPPAWIMARDVLDQDLISGYSIPAGSLVFLSPYVNHRLKTLWEEPERFDPLRFSPDRFNKLPKFSYFPFGGGQRLCLGKNFALAESLLAISLLIQRYKFSLQKVGVDGYGLPERILPDIDMRPKTPIFLRLENR